jgi:sugar/nucleoside kinase (ribokinase family)
MAFVGRAGGAPANVLAQAAILGARTAFIGMVGNDLFGGFLREELRRYGIGTEGLRTTHCATTTLTLIKTRADGERDFEFIRNPGADTLLTPDADMLDMISRSRIVQFGSVAMTKEPMRSTLFAALARCRGKALVAYDPNLRPMIWHDLDEMRAYARKGMEYADIVKLSEEEALALTGESDPISAARSIRETYGIDVILITRGIQGCVYCLGGQFGARPSYPVAAVDTTGAGDAFLGALLYKLLALESLRDLTMPLLDEYVRFANAAGALSVTRKGTMNAMADMRQISELIRTA